MNNNLIPNYKTLTRIPIFRRAVLQSFPFIEEDFDALTDYELLCKVVEYLNKVIEQQNLVGENTDELLRVYLDLKNYVEHYFDNLDVQDEINNKLDEMVEDGSFERLIDKSVMVYSVKNSSSCHIVKFPSGKVLIVDTGISAQWNYIDLALKDLNISKIDYLIITHFHPDHDECVQDIIDNYDVSECTFYVMQRPDFENYMSKFEDGEYQYYVNGMKIFEDNDITPVVPENNSYINIDSDYKFHFLNTSLDWFTDYYDITGEFNELGYCNLNQFSLYTEIINNESCSVISFTGDIEKCDEEKMTDYVHKTMLMTAPHHLSNRACFPLFYDATCPKMMVVLSPTHPVFTYDYYEEYIEVVRKRNTPIVSNKNQSNDGLLTFKVSKYGVTNFNTGDGIIYYKEPSIIQRLLGAIDWETQREDSVSLDNILYDNMVAGDIVSWQIDSTFSTNATQLYQDLLNLCPVLKNDGSWSIKLEKLNSGKVIITLMKYELKFEFTRFNKLSIWHIYGNGNIGSSEMGADYISGISSLITFIKNLGIGTFHIPYRPTGDELVTLKNATYDLLVNIFYNDKTNNNVRANVEGILRNTSSLDSNSTIAGIIDTYSSPNYKWRFPNIVNESSVIGMNNLISTLEKYKSGVVILSFRGTGDDLELLEDTYYVLTCSIDSYENGVLKANFSGFIKTTGSASSDKTRAIAGYINTESTPKYVIVKTNN